MPCFLAIPVWPSVFNKCLLAIPFWPSPSGQPFAGHPFLAIPFCTSFSGQPLWPSILLPPFLATLWSNPPGQTLLLKPPGRTLMVQPSSPKLLGQTLLVNTSGQSLLVTRAIFLENLKDPRTRNGYKLIKPWSNLLVNPFWPNPPSQFLLVKPSWSNPLVTPSQPTIFRKAFPTNPFWHILSGHSFVSNAS